VIAKEFQTTCLSFKALICLL